MLDVREKSTESIVTDTQILAIECDTHEEEIGAVDKEKRE